MRTLADEGRSVKLDLKEGDPVVSDAVALVGDIALDAERVWFNSELPVLGPNGFESLRRAVPAFDDLRTRGLPHASAGSLRRRPPTTR